MLIAFDKLHYEVNLYNCQDIPVKKSYLVLCVFKQNYSY